FALQMRTALMQDLPALLVEMGSAQQPIELRDISEGLDQGLSGLIRVCAEEQKTLRGWHAPTALTLKLALDRLAGVTLPLEATLARYALALRRTDPRMAAIGLAFSVMAPAAATPISGPVSGPLATLSGGEYRQLADGLRVALRDTVTAAQRIQQDLRGAHGRDAEVVAGVIEQMRTLVAWLRQQQERSAGVFMQAETVAAR
ncbi:MAG TPA: hypothetical protein VID72_10910, partial [Ktedonobacterales bacterium]